MDINCYILLCYSILRCILKLQDIAFGQSPPASLSFAVLVHAAPCCPKTSSLQRLFGLSTDLTSFIYYFVLLVVQLLSFIWAMYQAHFHLSIVMYSAVSFSVFHCPVMVFRILSFTLTFSISLSVARWLVRNLNSLLMLLLMLMFGIRMLLLVEVLIERFSFYTDGKVSI